MKTKERQETPEEETPKEGETEETQEEQEEVEKKLEKLISDRIENIVKSVKDNPVKKSPAYKQEPTMERSVLETDPFLRKARPFVKLSPKMEKFIQNVKDMASGQMSPGMMKALSEGDDSAGGFTVPEEFNAEVVRYQTEESIVRPRARVFNMTRDRMRLPKLDQDSSTDSGNTGSEHFAGISFSYTDEGDEKSSSDPRFGHIVLEAKKLVGLTAAADELLEDSAVNLANYLVALFGEGIAYKEDYEFLRGTGVGRPLGVVSAVGTVAVDRDTSSRIVLEDLLDLNTALPAWADKNAIWLTTKAGYSQLVLIGNESTTTRLQIIPSMQAGQPPTLLGKPLILTDKLPSVGTKGDIVLGDFSKYYVGDRGPIQVASSIHDRFRYDETTFRLVKRHDGQPAIEDAFKVLGA